jgi:hypothetical protein
MGDDFLTDAVKQTTKADGVASFGEIADGLDRFGQSISGSIRFRSRGPVTLTSMSQAPLTACVGDSGSPRT